MAMETGLLLLLVLAPAVYAADHTVGDSSGWSQGVDYTTWASSNTFTVGDTLTFSYSGLHSVDQVTKTNYESCTANALKSYNSGSDKVALDQAGDWYFICPTTGHCNSGMKLAITVSAASSTPSTPSPPSTTPTTPSPSPPSTTPSPPSTTRSPPSTTASAATVLYNMNALVIGASVVLALLLG